eukprot:CAMPEP_0115879018 /NCGR_PEP_ID=MMETSP0287-20121206/27092_1 /TAXON_ID=412157 /ORGANISM="Chrysochromulina rotalis, Strain UIO044" /LENGTH=41 /DNA_ID= /DNA_START= /DNA_END= /DNA_ORIENTATION=
MCGGYVELIVTPRIVTGLSATNGGTGNGGGGEGGGDGGGDG